MQEVTIINTANKQQIRCKQTNEGQYVEFLALKQSKTNNKPNNEYAEFLALKQTNTDDKSSEINHMLGEKKEEARIKLAEVYQAQEELDKKKIAIRRDAIQCEQLRAYVSVDGCDLGNTSCYRDDSDGISKEIHFRVFTEDNHGYSETLSTYADIDLLQGSNGGYSCGQMEINEDNFVYFIYNHIHLAPYQNEIRNALNEFLKEQRIGCCNCE